MPRPETHLYVVPDVDNDVDIEVEAGANEENSTSVLEKFSMFACEIRDRLKEWHVAATKREEIRARVSSNVSRQVLKSMQNAAKHW